MRAPAFVKTRYSGLIAVDDRPADGGLGLAGGDLHVLCGLRPPHLLSLMAILSPERREMREFVPKREPSRAGAYFRFEHFACWRPASARRYRLPLQARCGRLETAARRHSARPQERACRVRPGSVPLRRDAEVGVDAEKCLLATDSWQARRRGGSCSCRKAVTRTCASSAHSFVPRTRRLDPHLSRACSCGRAAVRAACRGPGQAERASILRRPGR